MSKTLKPPREGSLEAPTRHPIDWKEPGYYDESSLFKELERVFDVCHGCRRCFNLCQAFPTLFDAVDQSETGEVDKIDRRVYWEVAEHCYLCDMCYMSKCPYVPPHELNIDFPHLMLRTKAIRFRRGDVRRRDRMLADTDRMGRFAGIPVVVQMVNAGSRSPRARGLLEKTLGVHRDAVLPRYHRDTLRRRWKTFATSASPAPGETKSRVALFMTCYGNRNEPEIGEDLVKVFAHNGVFVEPTASERCCGMPKLETGDLDAVERAKNVNIPVLAELIDQGFDIVAPIPSCVLMFKQELPLLFPRDVQVQKVSRNFFDPFEYLMRLHKAGAMNIDFKRALGKVAYHAPCHLRVQNIGLKTRDALRLVPDTHVETIERCSGHNGTYAVKKEFHEASMRIGQPVFKRVEKLEADYYASDCPMAGTQIQHGMEIDKPPTHPLTLLRFAYGLN